MPPGESDRGEPTITKVPDALEDLFQEIDPDWLAYDATRHSEVCFTVILLTLDHKYTAWRACLSLDQRWTLSPLDWAGNVVIYTVSED